MHKVVWVLQLCPNTDGCREKWGSRKHNWHELLHPKIHCANLVCSVALILSCTFKLISAIVVEWCAFSLNKIIILLNQILMSSYEWWLGGKVFVLKIHNSIYTLELDISWFGILMDSFVLDWYRDNAVGLVFKSLGSGTIFPIQKPMFFNSNKYSKRFESIVWFLCCMSSLRFLFACLFVY